MQPINPWFMANTRTNKPRNTIAIRSKAPAQLMRAADENPVEVKVKSFTRGQLVQAIHWCAHQLETQPGADKAQRRLWHLTGATLSAELERRKAADQIGVLTALEQAAAAVAAAQPAGKLTQPSAKRGRRSDARALRVGEVLTREYKGKTFALEVLTSGFRMRAGMRGMPLFSSLSAAGEAIVAPHREPGSKGRISGTRFWGVGK
jgi:hypothetical protein